jgi:hypothetical protein
MRALAGIRAFTASEPELLLPAAAAPPAAWPCCRRGGYSSCCSHRCRRYRGHPLAVVAARLPFSACDMCDLLCGVLFGLLYQYVRTWISARLLGRGEPAVFILEPAHIG